MNIPIYYDLCTRVFHIHEGFSEIHFQWCIVSSQVKISTRDDPQQNLNDLEKAEMWLKKELFLSITALYVRNSFAKQGEADFRIEAPKVTKR